MIKTPFCLHLTTFLYRKSQKLPLTFLCRTRAIFKQFSYSRSVPYKAPILHPNKTKSTKNTHEKSDQTVFYTAIALHVHVFILVYTDIISPFNQHIGFFFASTNVNLPLKNIFLHYHYEFG